jgi:hypothetical protein
MNPIISLEKVREAKKTRESDLRYQSKLEQMDKLELLGEMIRFQEDRSSAGELTLKLISRGQVLFKILENEAETQELRELARTYCRHLKLELDAYLKAKEKSNEPRTTKKSV